jgi:hypothetical protein
MMAGNHGLLKINKTVWIGLLIFVGFADFGFWGRIEKFWI